MIYAKCTTNQRGVQLRLGNNWIDGNRLFLQNSNYAFEVLSELCRKGTRGSDCGIDNHTNIVK